MAIAYRSSSAVATGTTTLLPSMPPGTVENDVMIMALVQHNVPVGFTLPSGWTAFAGGTSTLGYATLAWKRAGGSEAGPYTITGLVDSACCGISSFSGCRLIGSPIGQSANRANAAGASGTAGITTTEDGCMIINAAAIMDNLAISAWLMGATGMTERFDGRTNSGSDTGIGLSTYLQSTAGNTGATAYTVASPTYENIGMCCSLIPLIDTTLTMASGASAVTSEEVGEMAENSTLVMSNGNHAVSSGSPVPIQHKTLAIDNTAHAVSSSTPTPAQTIVAAVLTQFFTWIVASPAVGGIPGPKLANNYDAVEISSYVVSESVHFNIEERSTIGDAGTNLLAEDQEADDDGTSATSFSNKLLAEGNYLWLDISEVSGSPGFLTVTLKCTDTTELVVSGDACTIYSSVPSLTQAHTLVVNDTEHAVSSSEPFPADDTDLVMANGSHAVSSGTPTMIEDSGAIVDVPLFYCWVISNPTNGTLGGPKITTNIAIDSIHSYIVGGTSVTFNIEERDTPTSSGTDAMASDQVALTTGAETFAFSNGVFSEDKYVGLHLSDVVGSPSLLVITMAYTASLYQKPDDCSHAVTSTSPAIGPALEMLNGEHAVTSDNITLSYHETPISFVEPGFYTWVVDNPDVGGIPGPKIGKEVSITEVSSYVTGTGGTVTFNIEERITLGSVGTNLLVSGQLADDTGESATTGFALPTLTANRYLWLAITSTSGTPGQLVVTLAREFTERFVNDSSHAVTSDNITLTTTHQMVVNNSSHAVTSGNITLTRKLSDSVDVTLTVTPCLMVPANCASAVNSTSPSLSGTARIYFPSSGAAGVSVTPNALWDEMPDVDYLAAVLEKGTTALASKQCTAQNFVATTVLNRQYVLRPAGGLTARSFTTADTFDFVLRCSNSSVEPSTYAYLTINAFSFDGLTDRGTLYSGYVNTTAISDSLQSRYCNDKNLTGNVSMQNGDILVFGIGIYSGDTTGAEFTLNQNFGDLPSTALSLSDVDTGADYPYLEFPFQLYEWSKPADADDCAHAVTSSEIHLGTNIDMDDAEHAVTSTEPTIAVLTATLVMNNGSHAVTSTSPAVSLPPGRKLWVKASGIWLQVAPDSGG